MGNSPEKLRKKLRQLSDVNLLTVLSSTYIHRAILVYPFLGYTDNRPNFIPEIGEVDHVIEVPLLTLTNQI